jgi:hypothetical protein
VNGWFVYVVLGVLIAIQAFRGDDFERRLRELEKKEKT